MSGPDTDPRLGMSVAHRRYVSRADVRYAGDLVNGAYALAGFGDAVTELAIRTDGDEGLLAGYRAVEFHAPIRAGDVVEFTATVTRVRTRSRTVALTCSVLCRATPERGVTAAQPLQPPVVAVTAEATVVVPQAG